ncbi:MAG: helix-turn-helix transcriptional regulator [Actinomycetota bacterium]
MQSNADSAQLGTVLGGVLRARREKSGRSLRSVAQNAGISPTHLSEVERGVKELSLARLGGLADALGVPAGEIFLDIAIALGAAPPRRHPVGFAPDPRDQIEWAVGRLAEPDLRSLADFGSFLTSQRKAPT